jgi:hypothetical protein
VQRVFFVEKYLALDPYLACHNNFREIFPDSRVPKKKKNEIIAVGKNFPLHNKTYMATFGTNVQQCGHYPLNLATLSKHQ